MFKETKALWVYWHTASIAYGYDILKMNPQPLRRLILPNPYGSAPDVLARVSQKKAEDIRKEIEKVTKEALEAKLSVRWFDGDVGNTLMMGEPLDSDENIGVNEWVQSESWFPLPADERPSFWAPSQEYDVLVKSLHKVFTAMWKQSHEPVLRGD